MGPGIDVRGTLKEKRHRHLEDLGNLLEPACSDPVRALLIFLNLLERETACYDPDVGIDDDWRGFLTAF